MGPSPAPPPSSSLSSSLGDWLLTASLDRDTQILTQALTHELSTPAISVSSLPLQQTLASASREQGFDASASSLHVLRALQQQHKQRYQQQRQVAMAPTTVMPSSRGWGSQDALPHLEHISLQMGSPLSSNSLSPLSTSNPGSPYDSVSTVTTSHSPMSMPIDSLLAHMKHLHRDVQGPFDGRMITQNALSTEADTFHSSRAASIALSSQSAQGVGSNKVSKRRSRASSRNPITVLSTDVLNFRAMVQQLTGIPSTPYMQAFGNSALLKPHATKLAYTNTESLPTLDTSASFLGRKPAAKDPLEGFSFAQGNHHLFSGSLPSGGKSGLQGCDAENMCQGGVTHNAMQSTFGGQRNVSSSASTLSNMWNYASNAKPRGMYAPVIEAQHFATKQAPKLPEEHHQPMKLQYSGEDPWLSAFDAVFASQAPNSETARMA